MSPSLSCDVNNLFTEVTKQNSLHDCQITMMQSALPSQTLSFWVTPSFVWELVACTQNGVDKKRSTCRQNIILHCLLGYTDRAIGMAWTKLARWRLVLRLGPSQMAQTADRFWSLLSMEVSRSTNTGLAVFLGVFVVIDITCVGPFCMAAATIARSPLASCTLVSICACTSWEFFIKAQRRNFSIVGQGRAQWKHNSLDCVI